MTTEFGFALLAVVLLVIYLVSVWSLYSQNKRLEIRIRDYQIVRAQTEDRMVRLERENKRLEQLRDCFEREAQGQGSEAEECWEHSSELNARIEKLEGELRRIGSPSKKITFCRDGHEESVLIARAALGEGK